MNIRIAIADDHPMIIGGLQNMLSNHSHIVLTATYANGEELLKGLQQDVPDVLLLDIQMPDKTGDELAPVILKKYPTLKILTLTNLDSTLYMHNMLRHGAQGYVLKTTDPKTVIAAIETVYNGGQYLDATMKDKLEQFTSRLKKEAFLKPKLTSREKEILRLIVIGDTSQEIADKLFIGFRTVEYYRLNILFKLDVKNTAALVKKALEMGLTE
jgi:DNA-binding NarL/FixJ family response regulator